MIVHISDCDHKAMREEEQTFAAAGIPFTLLQCRTEEDTVRQCKGANILLNQYAPLSRKVIAALAPELRLVIRYGVGVNNVDVDAAAEHGITAVIEPGGSVRDAEVIAAADEHDMTMVFTGMRHFRH